MGGSGRLLIRGGTVVNADRSFRADVYCEDGIIRSVCLCVLAARPAPPCRKVSCDLEGVPSDARVVDATGKLVIPGTLCVVS